MAYYLTIGELIPTYLSETEAIQLSQDSRDVDARNDTIIGDLIVAAESTVDTYIGRRYDLDAIHGDPPPVLEQLTARLTRWRLLSRRRHAITEHDREDYRDAMATLEAIARGTVTLGETPEPAVDHDRRIRTGGEPRRMTRGNLDQW